MKDIVLSTKSYYYNPDLIYFDGPNLFSTKNKLNNFTVTIKILCLW